MKQSLVIRFLGDDKDTIIPFISHDPKNSNEDWIVLTKPDGRTTFINLSNCKYFYFREEEKK